MRNFLFGVAVGIILAIVGSELIVYITDPDLFHTIWNG
jgi:hypothetical protein